MSTSTVSTGQAPPPARSPWRRAIPWALVAAAVVAAAAVIATLTGPSGRPYDPASPLPAGSRALMRVLTGYGVAVTPTNSLDTALAAPASSLVVVDPDAYSNAQLRQLVAAASHVVLIRPGTRAVAQALPGASPDPTGSISDGPACSAPGARATGPVDWPTDAVRYEADRAATRCFGGALISTARVTVLGSADVLRNDHLAGRGVAALDVDVLSADRRFGRVVWLSPGTDARGPGAASVWDLFPSAAHRVFLWLIVVAGAVLLWRGRRLGPVVAEALPVIVRSTELVEGHGRLYARAGARERAAATLRAATLERLRTRLALPPGVPAQQAATAAAERAGGDPRAVHALLAGPPPGDDAALLRLAVDLDRLEAALAGSISPTEGHR